MLLSELVRVLLAVLGCARPEGIGARQELDDLHDVLCYLAGAHHAPLEGLVDAERPGAVALLVEVGRLGQRLLCLAAQLPVRLRAGA